MPSKNKLTIVIILLLFAALVTLRHIMPKPVDWELNFSAYRKSPYGCSVMKDLLKDIFHSAKVETNQAGFYISLKENYSTGQNLIIINDRFDPDKLDYSALLNFIARGNSVFLSTLAFPDGLCDTLGIKTNEALVDTSLFKRVTEQLKLSFITGNDTSFKFSKRMPEHYFIKYDSANTDKLGTDRSGMPDFLHKRFGKGDIYLHCQPMAFTNFHMLYGNYQYACAALSLLPDTTTIWDQYYKPGKLLNTSPLRYILSTPPLRSAWYVLLFTIFIGMVFGSRRRQRPIPIFQPLQNTSLDFIRSVGKLYFRSQNHADLARKKVMYFREFLRLRYNFIITLNTPGQVLLISQKSGIASEKMEELMKISGDMENRQQISHEELQQIHHLIEEFYKNCK